MVQGEGLVIPPLVLLVAPRLLVVIVEPGGDRTGGERAMGGHGGSGSGGQINIVGSDGIGGLIDNTASHQAWSQHWRCFLLGARVKVLPEVQMVGELVKFLGSGGGGKGTIIMVVIKGPPGIVVVEEYT